MVVAERVHVEIEEDSGSDCRVSIRRQLLTDMRCSGRHLRLPCLRLHLVVRQQKDNRIRK